MSWEDVGVELVTVPSGPGRSPDDSSDLDTDFDDGLEELESLLWIHHVRLGHLLRTGHVSFTDWEHLLCYTVSMVLHVPLDTGSGFHGQPSPVHIEVISALASFLGEERVGPPLRTLLFVTRGIPRPGWEGFLVRGVGDVLHLPPTL